MTTKAVQEMLPKDKKPEPRVGHAIARGVAYSTLGNALLRVFDVCIAIVLLRALSVYDFGIYILALATYSFWTVAYLPGLQNVIVADAASAKKENEGHARALFSVYAYFLIAVGIVLWAGFYFAGDIFAHFVDGKGKYLSYVSWLFLLSPLEAIFNVKIAIFLDFGWVFVYKMLKSALRLAMLVGLLFFYSIGIAGAIFSTIFSMGIALLVVWIFYRRESWFSRISVRDIKTFWRAAVRTHGKWALAEDFFNSMTQNIQPFLIKFFLGAEAVALMSLASNLVSFAKTILPVRDVLFPTLPQTEDTVQFARYTAKLMKYATIAYILITLASAVGAPIVVYVLFPKYIPALSVFYILLFGLPVFGIRSVAVPVFFALKAQRSLFFIIVSRTFLALGLMALLTWLFGLLGAAAGMSITGVVTAISYLAEIRRRMPQMNLTARDIFAYDAQDKIILAVIISYMRRKFSSFGFRYL